MLHIYIYIYIYIYDISSIRIKVTKKGLLNHRLHADLFILLIIYKNGTHVPLYVIFVLIRHSAADQKVVSTVFQVFVETYNQQE